MRVLITGSEGSLMQWVIKHLVANGHDVVGVDNHARYDDYEHTKVVDNAEYEFHKADLTDYDRVMELMADIDGIINAAALIYGVKGFHEYPAAILSNDITIHRNILEGAKANDVERVAYLSSSMVYEQDEPPHNEDDVWDSTVPSTDYGLSKVVGERLSTAFDEQYDIHYTIWRPFNIITPYEKSEDEAGISHVFADFLRKILVEKQNPMKIFGDGEQVRCFTWIDEVAGAIAAKSFAEETRNEAYNLANPEPVTMKELAREIFAKGKERGLVEGEELEFNHVPIYDDDVKKRVPSVEKAKRDFGWNPQVKLDNSLERCIDNMNEIYDEL
ncbi:UDP-glucose 4-epimerase/UDP-glucuronate 4-epimerase [Halovenus aranensis]|uniref:UDP-glucose 4-epimerase/UDP-glucuronate 4-epimerase n=1 Tax=Halovenus aranensis TaxID=890420 RepID=A0A1G9A006_9EURY|nr:NAD(P)-dependent oxidoreductase [Halovenus aranensis]SDK20591.1 UDP-glucose 4-epimerase/UDP-glucuronate 4-epimerase [Halovenus aranensis]